jgi:hypothetical protein
MIENTGYMHIAHDTIHEKSFNIHTRVQSIQCQRLDMRGGSLSLSNTEVTRVATGWHLKHTP